MKKILIYIFVISLGTVFAQDPSNSLLYATPSMISPAMSGMVNGVARFNFSQRYKPAGYVTGNIDPTTQDDRMNFNSTMFSADAPLEFGNFHYGKIYRSGFSLVGSSDNARGMNITQVWLGGAFEVPLGVKIRYHHIRGGFQVGFIQRKLIQPDLYFEDQFNGFGFDGTTSENFINNSKFNMDVNMGAMWYRSQKIKGNQEFNPWAGFAVQHIARPNVKFFNEPAERLNLRYTIHAGTKVRTRSPFDFNINFLYMKQNNSNLFHTSLFARYVFYEKNDWFGKELADVMIGSTIRPGDAITFWAGSTFLKTYSLAFSYDYLIGRPDKRLQTNNYGGIQFIFTYTLSGKNHKKSELPYPMF